LDEGRQKREKEKKGLGEDEKGREVYPAHKILDLPLYSVPAGYPATFHYSLPVLDSQETG